MNALFHSALRVIYVLCSPVVWAFRFQSIRWQGKLREPVLKVYWWGFVIINMGRSKKNPHHEAHSLYLSAATHTNVNEQQMHIAWNSLCCIVFAAVCNVGAFFMCEKCEMADVFFFQIYIFGAEALDCCRPYNWEIYMNQLSVVRIALVVVAVIKTYKITFTLSVVLRLSSCPRN